MRYFVYTLIDAGGEPVYVGRSHNVRQRLANHASVAMAHPHGTKAWVLDVRHISLAGPFDWDQAVKEERAAIERLQPRANRSLTARDRRPAVAARSASRAVR